MLRRITTRAAPKRSIAGAEARPKRVSYIPRGEAQQGKSRLTFLESMKRDQEDAKARRSLPLWERIKSLPIIQFIVFMTLWSWAGAYAVPYLKRLTPGEYPKIGGEEASDELKARARPTPVVPPPGQIISNIIGGRKILSGAEPKIKL